MRYLRLLLVALAATLFVAVGAAGPAQAAPTTAPAEGIGVCSTQFGSDCETRSVQAQGGDVRIVLYAPSVGFCYYRVRDTNNWEVVRESSFWNFYETSIGGLHSRYRVELYSCPGFSEAHISG